MVAQWKQKNQSWLKRKKKDKGKDKVETSTGGDKEMANARLLEKMCDSLKPNFLLSDNGNLQEKNVWKNAFEKYTNYYRQVADITTTIYYDIFVNLCEA